MVRTERARPIFWCAPHPLLTASSAAPNQVTFQSSFRPGSNSRPSGPFNERIKAKSFTIDGEAVVVGPDGLSWGQGRKSLIEFPINQILTKDQSEGQIASVPTAVPVTSPA